jgi:6-phosphogluconate dehydrogenase
MAGGSRLAYDLSIDVLRALSAKAVDDSPCCAFVGEGGAGHFVKMVHNGLEYAEMELLAEVYSLLRWAVGLTPTMIADVLSHWKSTEANGYLLEITLNILREKSGDEYVIDAILDSAGHKGTGVWAVQAAASFGVPAMMITASLHARHLSAQRHIRGHLNDIAASQQKKGSSVSTNDVFKAFQLSRFINYHEGFAILRAASQQYGWNINLSDLSTIWTNGCIIRSALMNQFILLWKNWDDELILHPEVKQIIASDWSGLRRIIQVASGETIFTPCLVAASQYIAGASLRYPMANLIQAQRDYFGNDGFGTIDDPNGVHHHPWNRQ